VDEVFPITEVVVDSTGTFESEVPGANPVAMA